MQQFAYIVQLGKSNNIKIFGNIQKAYSYLKECYYSAFTGQPITLNLSYYDFGENSITINIADVCAGTIKKYNGDYKALWRDLNKEFKTFSYNYNQDKFGIEGEITISKTKIN